MMLHHATITKPAATLAMLSGVAGSITAEDPDPNEVRQRLLTQARAAMIITPTSGERHRFRAELLGETLATGNDRAEVMRKAVAMVSRIMMASQTSAPRRIPSRV